MLNKENPYDFRKELLDTHRRDVRNPALKPASDEFILSDGICIVIDKNASEVILTAARDFVDYLFTSQNVSARLMKGTACDGEIYISTKENTDLDLSDCAAYKGFCVEVSEKITVCGFDDRGAAQGLYFLEDEMNRRCAPFVKMGTTRRRPLFSPRMIHSGYGLDDYPDAYLNAIAHAGRDAILVFVKGVNLTPCGYLDFNNLIHRAAKYGIDVYAYSKLYVYTHPDAPSSDSDYEASYGELFRNCPGIRGVVLVGESVRFASRDPKVRDISMSPELRSNAFSLDEKPDPGWWPCEDYPKWLGKVRDISRKYNPDADIVFWTYNWGWAPAEDRIALINALPSDISLLVTFEMTQQYKLENITERCSDYTLSFEGPGTYFLSEAEAAKKCGIRLYSMTNTGGLTWDLGTVPYLPTPYQWMRRYVQILDAHEKYGLCGLMESHHYGFTPSFIGDLSNLALSSTEKGQEEHLSDILIKYFGKDNAVIVDRALVFWSEAIRNFVATDDDQYGPLRVGPAYPLLLRRVPDFRPPAASYAMFGNRIVEPNYGDNDQSDVRYLKNNIELCILPELRSYEKALGLWKEGLALLYSADNRNRELEKLINLGEYIKHTITTTINTKKWYIEKNKLFSVFKEDDSFDIIENLNAILSDEYLNTQKTIPFVEKDSRLGWEPSMEYIGHKENLEWKLSQLDFVRDSQLAPLKRKFGNMDIT
ncbi:MAG: hypothetical protein IJO61_04195 [Oscillospiraceae bacterium]|nr:hypothetical protein [Oscillospiraceae bacterium]